MIRRLVPRRARLGISALISEAASAQLRRRLAHAGASSRPIIVGPWLGEVGFELLYWVPFLRWAAAAAQLPSARTVVISRGGTGAWYRGIADRYLDVFDFVTPDEFHARNRARHEEVGEQKQVRGTAFEADLVSRARAHLELTDAWVLQPAEMFQVLKPYWWGHRPMEWIERHARYRRLDPDPALRPLDLPRDYTAVKFYFNDCFPPTAENRAMADRVVRRLGDTGPVVSLETGLRLDDHQAWREEQQMAMHGIRDRLTPSTNLGVQSAVIAGARRWAGTYGGFSYLAPFHGVPARAFYSNPSGFARPHLDLAQRVFSRFGTDLLRLTDVRCGGDSAERTA